MMQKSIDTFSALKIASYYNMHWPDYRVGLRNGCSIINTKKYCVVSYGRSVDKTVTYTLVDHSNQEAVLERYDKVKDVGVWFDEKLSFREHIQDKINKAYRPMMLGIIKRSFRHLTIPTFVLLYGDPI